MDSESWTLAVIVALLAGSAFFSASETALMSLGKLRVRHMRDSGVKGSARVSSLLEKPSRLLGAILVGNNLVNIGLSALTTSLCIEYFGAAGVGLATAIVTVVVLVFGEITPKSLAARHAERIAVRVAGPVSFLVWILTPLVVSLTFVTDGLARLLGGPKAGAGGLITEEELKTIVNVSHEEGVIETEEKDMINAVVAFGDSKVRNAMTPRTSVRAVDVSAGRDEIEAIFRDEHYSRLPVYDGDIDKIVGIINFKDFAFAPASAGFSAADCMRKPFFTYEHKGTFGLFKEMKKAKEQIAVVFDEYGGTAGIITMEDLLEEIVGEIEDEHDEMVQGPRALGGGVFQVPASLKVADFNALTGLALDEGGAETVGGYVLEKLGRLPEEGEQASFGGATFHVEKLDHLRLETLRVTVDSAASDGDGENYDV